MTSDHTPAGPAAGPAAAELRAARPVRASKASNAALRSDGYTLGAIWGNALTLDAMTS